MDTRLAENEAKTMMDLNEAYSDGHYPIGKGHLWHSGTHDHSDGWARPVVSGKLIAWRVNDDYQEVPQFDKITKEQFGGLPEEERGNYTLEQDGAYFVIKDAGGTGKVSSGFLLLEHHLAVHDDNGDANTPPLEIDFFTLYMNLLPEKQLYAASGDSPLDAYTPIARLTGKQIPFYHRWTFKIGDLSGGRHVQRYYEEGGKRIFKYSRCGITEWEGNDYKCVFDNIPGSRVVVDKNDLRFLGGWDASGGVKYRARRGGVLVYKTNMPSPYQAARYAVASLTADAEFESSIKKHYFNGSVAEKDWNEQTGYCEVKVKAPSEIQAYRQKDEFVLDYDGRFFPPQASVGSMTDLLKKCGLDDFYACVFVSSSRVVLKMTRARHQGQRNPQYTYGTQNRSFEETLEPGDCLEIDIKDGYTIGGRARYTCRFIYYYETSEGAKAPALIKASDLVPLRGYLYNERTLCTRTADGMIIFDSDSIAPHGNASGLLESGTEIELANPRALLDNPRTPQAVSFRLAGDRAEKYFFPALGNSGGGGMPLLAKIERRNEYRARNAVVLPETPEFLPSDSLLGKGTSMNRRDKAVYDQVCFFKDIAFLSNTAVKRTRYTAPAGAALYKKDTGEIKTYSFPCPTTFDIRSEGSWHKIRLVGIEAYFYYQNKPVPLHGIQASDTILADEIVLYDYSIKYTERGTPVYGGEAKKEGVRQFAEAFGLVIGKLNGENTSFREFYENDQERGYVNFERLPEFKMEIWVDREERLKITQAEGEAVTNVKSGAVEFQGYSGNPELAPPKFVEAGNTAKELVSRTPFPQEEAMGRSYYQIEENGQTCYVRDMEESSLLDWKTFINIVNEVDTGKSLYCGAAGEAKVDALAMPEEQERLSVAELRDAARKNKRKMICKHPLEWDKELYTQPELVKFAPLASGGRRFEAYSRLAETLDIWSGIKGKAGLPEENSLYYAHPVFFVNFLKQAGVFEFNPYGGSEEMPFPRDENKGAYEPWEGTTIKFVDSPGFAPVADGATKYAHEGVSYAEPASPYGIYRWNNKKEKGLPHTGVDLAPGRKNTEIKALVYGRVWVCSKAEVRSYGNVMIIKNTNEDLLYLLAHLHSFKKQVGDTVEPGEIVALTGNTTGGSNTATGIHLHIEVFRCTEKDSEKVLDLPYINDGKMDRDRFFLNSVAFNKNRVDPFNHDPSTHRV
jgi:murein DD-endopeptidase MepM/ murein hydrolase activator NlpD